MSMDLHIEAVRKCLTHNRKGESLETSQKRVMYLRANISGDDARTIVEESKKGKDALYQAIVAYYDEHSYIYENEEVDFPKDWSDEKRVQYEIWDAFGNEEENPNNFVKLPRVLTCQRDEIVSELKEDMDKLYEDGFDFDVRVI